MLSYQVLEKCTHAYRRGYRAGYEGEEIINTNRSQGLGDRPFSDFDFSEGVKAGKNDRYWDDVPLNVRRDPAMREELLANKPL